MSDRFLYIVPVARGELQNCILVRVMGVWMLICGSWVVRSQMRSRAPQQLFSVPVLGDYSYSILIREIVQPESVLL